eukprot:scaffold671232_cov57-Prasinocladus_malaysianus.AAC.1
MWHGGCKTLVTISIQYALLQLGCQEQSTLPFHSRVSIQLRQRNRQHWKPWARRRTGGLSQTASAP